jgi:hypothetical protein
MEYFIHIQFARVPLPLYSAVLDLIGVQAEINKKDKKVFDNL